jgi:hypothetical protein
MKKIAIAAPWMIVGIISVIRSTDVLKCDRITSTSANTPNAPVTK